MRKKKQLKKLIEFLNESSVNPDQINSFLKENKTAEIKQRQKAIALALRPQIKIQDLLERLPGSEMILKKLGQRIDEIAEAAEIKIKYEGYIQREKIIAEKIKRLERLKIPEDINYDEMVSISTEGRQKLTKIKPDNIGQAGRISGVSPSDINILLMYLGR